LSGTTGLTYTITAVANASSYTWTVPTGWAITSGARTNSITVTAGGAGQNGNITVTATNSCGTSLASSLPVVVSPATPATPGPITGTSPVCPGTTGLIYNIAAVPGATSYNWLLPTGWSITSGAGTNSITVSATGSAITGNIIVTATNSCGTSGQQSLLVTVSPGTPATPGTIAGPTPVCPGITGLVYTITSVATASSYNWTVPTGWLITAGSGTNSITVTAGAAGQNGNITVTATNSCGTSTAQSLPVVVSPGPPATPGIITGNTEGCINQNGLTYSIAAVPNATSYTWATPTGWTIASGQGTTAITVNTTGTAIAGNITVTATNSCGTSSSASTLPVTISTAIPATPGAITGPLSICPVASGLVYSVTPIAGATNYNWTLPTGWSITAGAGTNSITATAGSSATTGTRTISVTASNACGTSAASNLNVTVGTFASVDAGPDQTVCATTATINYSATVGGAIGGINDVQWTSSNGGTFTNSGRRANGTYTPSAAAIAAGSVTLTITTDDPAGTCAAVSDQFVITFRPTPTASISGVTPICSGSTTTITFTATPNTSVNYTIGGVAQTPISVGASGTATLTTAALSINTTYALTNVAYSIAPTCSAAASGSALITVNAAPTVNANSDQTVCASSPNVTLNGSITGSITTGTWTTAGTGTFNNATALNAVYTPSATDITAGSVTLTLTSGDPPGPCNPVADQMVITINPAATANANVDQAVCASSPNVTLAGSVGGSATTGTWTTAGTGTFNNATALNAVYTPSATDITAGSVTLTLTSNDPAGPCVAATDQMTITINASATASANVDQTVCASSPNVTLAGSVGGGATTGTWTTAGTGIFNNANALNAVYTPSAAEITAGTVTLTLTTNDPPGWPCGAATDQMIITINPAATANA
jgi:hypothetical protein